MTGRIPLLLFGATALLLLACGGEPGPGGPSTPPLSHLSLFPDRWTGAVGDQVVLRVTARDQGGADLPSVVPSFATTDARVATVDRDGEITVLGSGTATVRATAGGLTAETIVYAGAATYDIPTQGPPRVLPFDYIDLSKVDRVSRFRSTVGHSYTDGSETCRSMKHYFMPKPTVDWTSVDVYAPATGTIWNIASEGSFGFRIHLRPRDLPVLQITIFHVTIDAGIEKGMWIEAGAHLGRHASSGTMSDIAMSIGPKEGGELISYFIAMTDPVFAEYQARGVVSRESAIITEAERDADPVPCVGEQQFTVRGTIEDWVYLN